MQQLRKQNALLLKLINSKTRQNQLVFQQYEQLTSHNHNLEMQISALKKQQRELRRSSFTTKEQPRYTYAVLNSPRTEKLELEVNQLKKSIGLLTEENQRLVKQLQQIANRPNQTAVGHQARERIEVLQRSLSKKEKEMQELTLIMYAKDAAAAQIVFTQSQLHKQINVLDIQIEELSQIRKQQQDQCSSSLLQKEKHIEQLQSSLHGARQQLMAVNQSLVGKEKQIDELQQIIKAKSNNLQDLSQFMNEQAGQLQIAQATIQKLHAENASYLSQLHPTEYSNSYIEENNSIIAGLQQKIKSAQIQLAKKEEAKLGMEQRLLDLYMQHTATKQSLLKQIEELNDCVISRKAQVMALSKEADQFQRKMRDEAQSLKRKSEQDRRVFSEQQARHQSIIGALTRQADDVRTIIQQNQQLIEQINNIKQIQQSSIQAQQYREWAQRQMTQKDQSIQAFMDILQKLQSEIRLKDLQISQIQDYRLSQEDSVSSIIDSLLSLFKFVNNGALVCSLQKLQQLYSSQRKQWQEQGQELRKSFTHLLTQNNSLKQQIDGFNQSLDILNALITQRSQKLQRVQQSQQALRRQLQETISLYSKAKERLQQASLVSSKKKSGDYIEREQYVQMLNAVIESIKNQHQQSISKIQSKNMIIYQLEKRLQQTEDNYNQEITTLRNSIINQNDVVSYQKLAEKYKRAPKVQKQQNKEQIDELLKEIDALREQIKVKDAQIKAKDAQLQAKDSQRSAQSRINKSEERILYDSQVQVEPTNLVDNNNSKPFNMSCEMEPQQYSHHFYEQNKEQSELQLQNQQMQETISQQNYIIMELQDNLIKIENQYNSQIIMLKRNIAELNGEVIVLKKNLYEVNPQSLDLTTFLKPNRIETPSFRAYPQTRCQSNYFRPASHQSNISYKRSQQLYEKGTVNKNGLQNSLGLDKRIKTSSNNHKNPYISMMTNEKGQLKFPQSGNWSIEQLRSLLKQPPK